MKLIDEKGRLFGKINLIDLLVILLVVAVAAAVLWKTVGKRAAESANTQSIRAEYTVLCAETPKEICDYAETQVGEKLLNNAVFLDASITQCRAELIDANAPEKGYDLYITIDAAASTANSVFKVASQEIRVGYEYNVNTPYFELPGVICDLEVRYE